MKKFELHAHTAECDVVAKLGGADLVEVLKSGNYELITPDNHK